MLSDPSSSLSLLCSCNIIGLGCLPEVCYIIPLFLTSCQRLRAASHSGTCRGGSTRVSGDTADRVLTPFATSRVQWSKEHFAPIDPHPTILTIVVLICNASVPVITVPFALVFVPLALKFANSSITSLRSFATRSLEAPHVVRSSLDCNLNHFPTCMPIRSAASIIRRISLEIIFDIKIGCRTSVGG